MKKGILALLLLGFTTACTMNASQEQALNSDSSKYLAAYNSGNSIRLIARTHPAYVSYIRSKGDSFFLKTFAKKRFNTEVTSHITIENLVEEKNEIQVLLNCETTNFYTGKVEKNQVVGISKRNGLSWFFMPFSAYQNKGICPKIKRVLLD